MDMEMHIGIGARQGCFSALSYKSNNPTKSNDPAISTFPKYGN
jgi:hypothetical protein